MVLMVLLYLAGIDALRMLYTPLPYSKALFFLYLLIGGVIGPLAEEIFFRGILYGYLRRWGVYAAVTVSTLLFVLPHLTGSNLPVTQLVGGIVFAIAEEFGLPVRFVGVGQEPGDLAPFDPEAFVDALLGYVDEREPETARATGD